MLKKWRPLLCGSLGGYSLFLTLNLLEHSMERFGWTPEFIVLSGLGVAVGAVPLCLLADWVCDRLDRQENPHA